ncbi:hypothetical protein CC85DRAFT_52820 [Cutaneotrichosporon oleaginosum]|uniref:Uncharacterized protein n=1 Tax=Cutaneotrichosporon oleaginosum TaxID=879819 RepID=A0A0J0XQS8_9TREE|nr:uncharacterized protein CC85DRAFT_52820 [Cutaneotrichosporon oleaginosum]KLT43438.1 hypothetical protein CC85DRAFT_52820 [Cutaneotrichosporon oleaginosum]TXT05349.1 hypothetical protein COLE_06669 [Cutaneotrichosporon oleaginosum]
MALARTTRHGNVSMTPLARFRTHLRLAAIFCMGPMTLPLGSHRFRSTARQVPLSRRVPLSAQRLRPGTTSRLYCRRLCLRNFVHTRPPQGSLPPGQPTRLA